MNFNIMAEEEMKAEFMANGLHSTIETLSYKLLERWVPKWYEAFSDNERGGFYERLGHSFKPVMTGQRHRPSSPAACCAPQ